MHGARDGRGILGPAAGPAEKNILGGLLGAVDDVGDIPQVYRFGRSGYADHHPATSSASLRKSAGMNETLTHEEG